MSNVSTFAIAPNGERVNAVIRDGKTFVQSGPDFVPVATGYTVQTNGGIFLKTATGSVKVEKHTGPNNAYTGAPVSVAVPNKSYSPGPVANNTYQPGPVANNNNTDQYLDLTNKIAGQQAKLDELAKLTNTDGTVRQQETAKTDIQKTLSGNFDIIVKLAVLMSLLSIVTSFLPRRSARRVD